MSITPAYTARIQLFVATQNSGSVLELQQGNTFTQARVASYVQTAKTPVVLQPVIDALGIDTTPAELASKIEAGVESTTVLISISATDESPVRAAAIAEAVGGSLISAVERLESPNKDGISPVRLSVITPATAPSSPSSPNTSMYLAAGLLFGLAIGVGAGLLRNSLDTRIRGEVEVRRITGTSILGGVAFDANASKKPLLTHVDGQSPRAEAFRQIRTNLQFAHVSKSSRSIMITSSLPGEGKSTTAVNIAIAMAQTGQRVILVDADLRRPMVGEYLGLDGSAGLTTVLVGNHPLESLVQRWGQDELYVLTSGRIPPNPSELLGSSSMTDLVSYLEQEFDAVIIDAPPLLPVTDAAVLAQRVGGVVLVVGSQLVKAADLQRSLATLEKVDADILGVILNRLAARDPHANTYGYYSRDSSRTGYAAENQRSAATGTEDFDRIVFGSSEKQDQS